MQQSTNYNFNLPEATDFADIADLSANWEDVDEIIHNHEVSALASENGVHGTRLYNNKLQIKNGNDWEDAQACDVATLIKAGIVKPDGVTIYIDADGTIHARQGRYLPSVSLGTSYTAELKADITSGKFEKTFTGGYLTINDRIYDLAHPNYLKHCGDTECTTNHFMVVPRTPLVNGTMNSTHVTTGGYPGSDFKTGNNSNTALAQAKAIIEADFGAENILHYREYFETAVTDGRPSGGAWADAYIELMNERMVYGNPVFTVANDGTHIPTIYTTSKTQLELFAKRPDLICCRANWWLRDPVSAAYFACVGSDGLANYDNAGGSNGIRPVFAIC